MTVERPIANSVFAISQISAALETPRRTISTKSEIVSVFPERTPLISSRQADRENSGSSP